MSRHPLSSSIAGAARWLSCFAVAAAAAAADPAPTFVFRSGFEPGTLLGSAPGNGPNGIFQTLSGTDASTGSTWPLLAWNASTMGVHVDPPASDSGPYAAHFANAIVAMTGHAGAPTRALHLGIDGYPPYVGTPQTMIESNALRAPVHGYYLSAWLMLPPSLGQLIADHPDAWHSLWAFKTPLSYRQEISVTANSRGGGAPVWHVADDVRGWNEYDPRGCGLIDPNTGAVVHDHSPFAYRDSVNTAVPVPLGRWFFFEIYVNRSAGSDGRFLWAVDGRVLFDFHCPNYGLDDEEVFNLYHLTDYSNYFPAEMWVDDLTISDGPPSPLPRGPDGAGATASPLPPFIDSAQGAIGVVGAPFTYRATTASGARTDLFQAWNLPPGLQLDGATGAVSGTPTTAGRFVADIRAIGPGGFFDRTVVMRIDAAAGTPVIGALTATPATIASGAATTLAWRASGAALVTIQPTPTGGDGTIVGSSAVVAPTRTTTYTLAATNDAGTVTRSVTVTVAAASTAHGGAPWPVPGTIQAEDVDDGGEGIAYHDRDVGNDGGGYRATDVDIRASSDLGGGWQVGWFGAGEWLQYSIAATAGAYDLGVRVASGAAGATVHLSIDGRDVTGPMTFAGTGSWDAFTTIMRPGVAIAAGPHLLRLTCDAGALDCNWLSATASTGDGIVSGQWYEVIAKHSGDLLAVTASSTANAADVWQWHADGTTGEQWRLDAIAPGVYTLTARCSGQVLDMGGWSTAPGGDAIQWPLHGGANQQWRFEPVGGGYFRIVNVNSGLALDVAGTSTADGANVIQWIWWGGDNQRWSLVPLAPASVGSLVAPEERRDQARRPDGSTAMAMR